MARRCKTKTRKPKQRPRQRKRRLRTLRSFAVTWGAAVGASQAEASLRFYRPAILVATPPTAALMPLCPLPMTTKPPREVLPYEP